MTSIAVSVMPEENYVRRAAMNLKLKQKKMRPLSDLEVKSVNGGGLFYDLGQFFGVQANITSRIRRTYGRTATTHIW